MSNFPFNYALLFLKFHILGSLLLFIFMQENSLYITPYPSLKYIHNVVLLIFCKLVIFGWNTVPFLKAAAAAGGGCVLGYKNRVVSHRCLLAVVGWIGGGKPCIYKVPAVI